MCCVLVSPPLQKEREGNQRKRETGAQLQVIAGLLSRNPAMTYMHALKPKITLAPVQNEPCVAKSLWRPCGMKNYACAPTVPRGTVGAQAETRVWHRTAGHRRASLQEPCDDLYAHYESELASETHPKRPNLAGHRSNLLSKQDRNANTSLGIAPNCFQSAPETTKPRWASLQIALGAPPKR